jgi:4-hydroxybenzoate polyprenyltransferase
VNLAGLAVPMLQRYLACIRYRDAIVLQGPPLFGVAFALRDVTMVTVGTLLVFLPASLLLVAHIFTLNDWANITQDLNDPHKAADVFLAKGISRAQIGGLCGGFLLVSLALFGCLPARTFSLAVAIAALGWLYSHPLLLAKGVPLVSSGPHLIGGTLHFLLGYSVFTEVDGRGVLIALFFALTFTAGHLNQEVRDYDGDRHNGIQTNAVRFGKTQTFVAGLMVFTVAYAHLVFLASAGLVPVAQGFLAALYPIHLFWSIRTLRAGLTFETVSRFQSQYRALYALIGVFMLLTLLAR